MLPYQNRLFAIAVAMVFVTASNPLVNAQQDASGNQTQYIPSPLSTFEAPQSFAESTQKLAGKELTSIALEAFIVWVPEENVGRIWKTTIAGSSEIHRGRHPDIKPTSTMDPKYSDTTEVHATSRSFSAWPVRTAAITDTTWKQMSTQIKRSTAMNIIQAPTTVVYDGQAATVSDTQNRPFVIDVNTISKDGGIANLPVIKLFDDGTKFVFKAKVNKNQIMLRGDLAISEVESVETFNYSDFSPSSKQKNGRLDKTPPSTGVTVQVPRIRMTTVHFASAITQGNAIIVDPMHRVESTKTEKTLFGKKSTTKLDRMLLVVLPKILSQEDVATR